MKTLKISLSSIQWNEAMVARKRSRALRFTLIWPRPGIAAREQLREVPSSKKTVLYAEADFSERCLFKERVEGPFALIVEASESLEAHRLEAWFLETTSLVISQAVQGITSGIDSSAMRKLIRQFSDQQLDQLSEESQELEWIASGEFEMTSDDLIEQKMLKLKATETLTKSRPSSKSRRSKAKATITKPDVILKKGDTVADVLFDVTID